MNGLNSDTLILIKEQFVEFDIKKVMGGSNDVYLRFGYWRKVNIGKLQELIGAGIKVVEDDIDDDECGTLWSYKLK